MVQSDLYNYCLYETVHIVNDLGDLAKLKYQNAVYRGHYSFLKQLKGLLNIIYIG